MNLGNSFQNGNLERVLLLDGSAISPIGRDSGLSDKVYNGFDNISREILDSNFESLKIIYELDGVISISEAIKEKEELLNILNYQVSFRKRCSENNATKNHLKNKKVLKRRNQVYESNLPETLSEVETYCNLLHRTIHDLKKRGDPRENFDSTQKEIYRHSLNLANKIHNKVIDIETRRTRVGNYKKLGDQLNTDNLLIATALGISLYNPVTFLTRDNPLRIDLEIIKNKIKREGERITYLESQQDISIITPEELEQSKSL